MTRGFMIGLVIVSSLGLLGASLILWAGGPPPAKPWPAPDGCVVVYEVKRGMPSLSMTDTVRPNEQAQILDCAGHLRHRRRDYP